MRSLFSVSVIAILFTACSDREGSAAANVNAVGKLTSIYWMDSLKTYGNIQEGQKLAVSFRFRNSGNNPLVIESVTPACGCTVADYPREPIAPGKEGEITGEFNSQGRAGFQHKRITVRANADPGEQPLIFEVNVVPNKNSQ